MADPDLEAVHPVEAASPKMLRPKTDAPWTSSDGSHEIADIDNLEKAQAIAEHDLHGPRKQTYSGIVLAWLSFQATGVIYGDIGTSPLYVYSSTFSAQPSWQDLVGALSIIIWSLTLMVSVKYCFIVLHADDDGQGGTFALYSLLTRFTRIARPNPRDPVGYGLRRHNTNDLKAGGKSIREFLERSRISQFSLQFIGVLGVSMVMADGVLTPAQSVLGAIQGITVINSNLKTPAIVGISCAILVLLFVIQPFGTAKIGTTFAPIVVIWLLFNLCVGIYNLALHDYTVLKAFSPHFAFTYLIRNGHDGWRSLGGLLLAFTGIEALFADLGAFSKRAIQISWLCFVYPCLVVAYIGQAAYISTDKTQTAYTNPFFKTLPPGSLYFGLIIAILAAIVASQAMITSTFQLLSQIMRLSYFPHIKVTHTSTKFHEQVYMPLANWLLMIGTVIVTAVYNNTTSLGNAYGVCVISVTFISTCMVALVAILVWRLPAYIVLPIWLVFAALDGAFLSAVYEKVPDGAWFTLLLAFLLSSVFALWRFGKETQWHAEGLDNLSPQSLFALDSTALLGDQGRPPVRLRDAFGGATLSTVPSLGIFFDKAGNPKTLPPSFAEFVKKFATRPGLVIFFHMRALPVPSVALEDRYVVTRMSQMPGSYSVTLRHGYTDDVLHPGMARDLIAQIELALIEALRAEDTEDELQRLRASYSSQVVYVLGKETMRIRHARRTPWGLCRHVLLWLFLWIRENSRAKLADLDIDADKVVEVGFLKDI